MPNLHLRLQFEHTRALLHFAVVVQADRQAKVNDWCVSMVEQFGLCPLTVQPCFSPSSHELVGRSYEARLVKLS
eukprot:SAG31_NODE_607_length_13606_cov_11.366699_16_plen_74_part_00